MFEGNNKNNNENKDKTHKKYSLGRSEFTRDKLQSDYHPKPRRFKAQLIKTQTDHNKIISKLQFDKEEANVIERAVECFKKKQLIQIDWKTKSNFRKSNGSVQLPRIKSQDLSRYQIQNIEKRFGSCSQYKPQESRLFKSINKLDNFNFDSLKQRSVSNKLTKLRLLLLDSENSTTPLKNSLIQINHALQDSPSVNKNQIRSHASIDMNEKDQIINTQKHEIEFHKLRSKTGIIEPLIEHHDQLDEIRSQRQNIKNDQYDNDDPSNAASSIYNENHQLNHKQQVTNEKYEKYDILADHNVYLLISKSREKIINFKEKIIVSSMTPLQKINYWENKKKEINYKTQSQIPQQKVISQSYSFNSKKYSLKHKFQQKRTHKPQVSQFSQKTAHIKTNFNNKDQKDKDCIFKRIQSEHSICEGEEQKYEIQQKKVIKKKDVSLVKVQERLLKKVKLKFLKQDLQNKFFQLRELQNLNRLIM